MLPILVIDNPRYKHITDTVIIGYFLLCVIALCITMPYLAHLIGCEFRLPMLFTAWHEEMIIADSVVNVFSLGNPFKIFNAVINLVTILMVGYCTFWAWTDKCLKNKDVNECSASLSSIPERDPQVSTSCWLWIKNVAVSVCTVLFQCTYMAKIANFVKTFISDNWFPNLIHGNPQCKTPLVSLCLPQHDTRRRYYWSIAGISVVANTLYPHLPVLASKARMR